jgi:hypothetical protein
MARFVPNSSFSPRFDKAVGEALAATVAEFESALREAIESAVYFWPNQTIRSTGEVANSPRDIVDSGTFRDSQRATQISLRRWEISWEVAYAVVILLGFQGVAGNSQPGRDWIGYALSNIDLAKVFSEELRGILR